MLKLIDRYIGKQFLVTFLFASTSFAALFTIIHMVDNLDDFTSRHIPTMRIVTFYIFGLPETFLLTTPLSILLSALFVTGKLSMQSELPALKSAGVSLARLLRPYLLVAGGITLLNFVNSCWIVPATYDWSRGFEKRFIKNETADNSAVHVRESANRILTVNQIGHDLSSGLSVSLEQFDKASLTARIDADSVRVMPAGKPWIFYNARQRTFNGSAEHFTFTRGPLQVPVALSQDTFRMISADPDQMTLQQLWNFLHNQQKAGISGLEKATVKLHTKVALPFAALIIVFIGVPLSTRKKRSGLAMEASISLIVGFLYLGMQKTLSSLGYSGLMNPIVAAWLPNALFAVAGALLCHSANE